MFDKSFKHSFLNPRKALVVDADPTNLTAVCSLLETVGFHVSTEINGSRGLDRVLNVNFDVVLIADRLPIIAGHELVEVLRRKRCATPIVAMTTDLTIRDWTADGFNSVLRQPVREGALMEVLAGLSLPGRTSGSTNHSNLIARIEKLQQFLRRPRLEQPQSTNNATNRQTTDSAFPL